MLGGRDIGAIRRREDLRLLRGLGRHVGDLRMMGLMEVSFVRSSHASAQIRSIRKDGAASLPGVLGV